MIIYFNLHDKYKNTLLLNVNSTVNADKVDYYENYTVIRDKDFNIKSINFLNNRCRKLNNFGYYPKAKFNKLKKELQKLNPKYTFSPIKYFQIGKVIKRETHPKSDKLYVLEVDFGKETKQIITNTTYTTEGKYFVWCLPGSVTAEGLEITVGKIMGIESYGMLCSAKSLDMNKEQAAEYEKFLNDCDDSFLGKGINEFFDI